MQAREALAIRNLTCHRAGVRDVTFSVRAGEIVGLAGLVGAGRSELARTLFGLTPADAGDIRIDGALVTPRTPREAIAHGIAYVPEDRRRHGVIGPMPVRTNVTLASLPQLSERLAVLSRGRERDVRRGVTSRSSGSGRRRSTCRCHPCREATSRRSPSPGG